MDCKKEENKENCGCTYDCPRKGLCCECVAHHRANNEVPGCFFPEKDEASYDRSIKNFIESWKDKV